MSLPRQATQAQPRKREVDLDVARGLILIMVAFCHSINTDFHNTPHWFQVTYLVLNMFLMQAFMFVSGIVLGLSVKPIHSLNNYLTLSLKRTARLLIPYVLFALLVFAGKLLLQEFATLEKTVTLSDLPEILIRPKASQFGSYLWFICVLLQYYLVVPLIQWLIPRWWLPLCLVLAIILQFVPGTDFLAIKQFNQFFLYFVLGIVARRHYDVYLQFIKRFFPLAVLALALALTLLLMPAAPIPIMVISLLSIPVLHQLARTRLVGSIRFIHLVGIYMYPVYLMNTIFINLFKIGYGRFLPLHGTSFVFYAVLCVAVGTLGPIAAQKLIISKIPYLNSIIR